MERTDRDHVYKMMKTLSGYGDGAHGRIEVNDGSKSDEDIMHMGNGDHDWSDEECVEILSNIYGSSPRHARLFIAEHLGPSANIPHFSKLFTYT